MQFFLFQAIIANILYKLHFDTFYYFLFCLCLVLGFLYSLLLVVPLQWSLNLSTYYNLCYLVVMHVSFHCIILFVITQAIVILMCYVHTLAHFGLVDILCFIDTTYLPCRFLCELIFLTEAEDNFFDIQISLCQLIRCVTPLYHGPCPVLITFQSFKCFYLLLQLQ